MVHDLITLLIWLIVLIAILGICWWVLSHVALPEPARIVIIAIVAIIALLMLLRVVPLAVPGR